MNTTTQYNTFWDILQNIGIETPPIQRDYAQGREIEKVRKIRSKFLESIIHALENGNNIITERYLKELCEENGQYVTPHLNDTLYLHYKGIFILFIS